MDEQPQHLVARAVSSGTESDLDAAVAALRAHAGRPGRGALAAALLRLLVRSDPTQAMRRLRHIDELVATADQEPPAGPQWPRLRAGARAFSMLYASSEGTLTDVGAALRELDQSQATVGDDPGLNGLLQSARTGLTFVRALSQGDRSTIARMPEEIERLSHHLPAATGVAQLIESLTRTADVATANQGDDQAAMRRAIDAFAELAVDLPSDSPLHTAMQETSARMRALRGADGMDAPAGARPTGDAAVELAAMLNRADATDTERVLGQLAAGAAALGVGETVVPARIDEGIEHFRQAIALSPADGSRRAFGQLSLALALYRRTEVAGTVDDLDEVIDLLERCRDQLDGPGNPQWTMANELLAAAQGRLMEYRQAHESGLDAQRGYAWRALLQPDPTKAREAIQEAAEKAVEVARRCLLDGRAGDAMTALDTGRGLILFAATERRRIPDLLRQAGHAELLARWEAAGTTEFGPDDELRLEVLTALSNDAGAATDLLDPPGFADVQAALATVDADALVYLIPGGEPPLAGAAIIAPVDEPARVLLLPNLRLQDQDVERYLGALDSRDLTGQSDASSQAAEVAASLARLCDWAWRAAIGPLLRQYVATRPAPATGRVPRLILVPMGDLARIPWAAARHADGQYAVELAAFSQIASARMLYACASQAPVPITSVGLIVGDPDTGGRAPALVGARREAYDIRQAYYPQARYVGRRPDGTVSPSGPGTADQVRRWLAEPDPAAGSVLHLACHGSFRIARDDAESCLMLAPGRDPRERRSDDLGAEEVITLMTTANRTDVALVVLAACNTGRSIYGFDEAYSLGTAFLAGGARAVLSTQWSIPDVNTCALMFMFHHYLRGEGRPVWDALRQAQLWMLNPHREPPARMPVELRPESSAVDIMDWAGFIHWGQ